MRSSVLGAICSRRTAFRKARQLLIDVGPGNGPFGPYVVTVTIASIPGVGGAFIAHGTAQASTSQNRFHVRSLSQRQRYFLLPIQVDHNGSEPILRVDHRRLIRRPQTAGTRLSLTAMSCCTCVKVSRIDPASAENRRSPFLALSFAVFPFPAGVYRG